MHASATTLTSALLALLGVAMIVRTIADGGSPLSLGILLGVLFLAAGAGRLHLQRKAGED